MACSLSATRARFWDPKGYQGGDAVGYQGAAFWDLWGTKGGVKVPAETQQDVPRHGGLLLAGFGGIWRNLAGFGGTKKLHYFIVFYEGFEFHGIWRNLAGPPMYHKNPNEMYLDTVESHVAGFGGIWRDLAGFGGIWRDLA